jgi:hypothetical protein
MTGYCKRPLSLFAGQVCNIVPIVSPISGISNTTDDSVKEVVEKMIILTRTIKM